ncbi:hypothetical protein BH11ACT7_BH11ACT7_06360 [soil metagenome]
MRDFRKLVPRPSQGRVVARYPVSAVVNLADDAPNSLELYADSSRRRVVASDPRFAT